MKILRPGGYFQDSLNLTEYKTIDMAGAIAPCCVSKVTGVAAASIPNLRARSMTPGSGTGHTVFQQRIGGHSPGLEAFWLLPLCDVSLHGVTAYNADRDFPAG